MMYVDVSWSEQWWPSPRRLVAAALSSLCGAASLRYQHLL